MYDPVAREYAEQFHDELDGKPFDRALLDAVAARCDGGVLADLGCGPGQVGGYAGAGAGVGLDLSHEMCRLVPFPVVQGDLRALPFRLSSLAGAVAFYCYIHLDALDDAFADAFRALRPGGVLVVSFHEGDGEVLHRDEWYGKPIDISVKIWPKAEVDAALVRRVHDRVLGRARGVRGRAVPALYVTAIRK